MTTATVFGGSGFIGQATIRRLVQQAGGIPGIMVQIPTRHTARAAKLRPLGKVGQIVALPCDVTDPKQVVAAIDGSAGGTVINLTGILFEKGGSTFDRIHHELPARIAEACAAAGVKTLIHISAIGAAPGAPSRYGQSKYAGEQAVLTAFPKATILRPSLVFGPGDGFFSLFGRMAQLSPVLPLIDGGKTRFQPVYVGDVADAVFAAIQQPAAQGQVFELGGPETYTFEELLRLVVRETGQRTTFAHIPLPLARIQARLAELMPKPLLTRDQLLQLGVDNVVSPGAKTLADLGIIPTALEVILPTYMEQFRPGGRFGRTRTAA